MDKDSENQLYEAEIDWRKAVVGDLKSLDRRLVNTAFFFVLVTSINVAFIVAIFLRLKSGH